MNIIIIALNYNYIRINETTKQINQREYENQEYSINILK